MSGIAIELRELTAQDIDAVTAIEAAVAPSPWSRGLFEGELTLSAAQRLWLVAHLDNTVVGFAGVMFVGDDVHVMNIAVDPQMQRQGIANRLFASVLRGSVERGAVNATLEVRRGNEPATALYRRFRMAPVGIRTSYYDDGEDALILWAHDIDTPEYVELLDTHANQEEVTK